jgi:predicted RNA-binding Zn-ribbon protein involved in translation (DUF1610 family)
MMKGFGDFGGGQVDFMSMMQMMVNAQPKGMGKGMKGCGKGDKLKPGDWRCEACGDHQFAKNSECRKCGQPRSGDSLGMKPGDWHCPTCQDLQFARNTECRKCGTPNPDPAGSQAAMEAGKEAGYGGAMEKPGDWYCPNCGDLQFARNQQCRKCGTANPDPEGSAALSQTRPNNVNEKPGDWYCPSCGDLQFAKNQQCRKCGTKNPDPEQSMALAQANGAKGSSKGGQMKPGDWHCSGCGDLQFAKNTQCRKCGTPNYAMMLQNVVAMQGAVQGAAGAQANLSQMLAMMASQGQSGAGRFSPY